MISFFKFLVVLAMTVMIGGLVASRFPDSMSNRTIVTNFQGYSIYPIYLIMSVVFCCLCYIVYATPRRGRR